MSTSTLKHSDNHHSLPPQRASSVPSNPSESQQGQPAPKSTEQDVPTQRATLRDRLDDGLDDTFPASDPISAGTLQKQDQEDHKIPA